MPILRSRVFGWFPSGDIPFHTRRRWNTGGYAGKFADFGDFEFDTEPGVRVSVAWMTPWHMAGPVPLLIWIKGEAEQVAFPDIDEFHPFLRTHALAVLTPRLTEKPMGAGERADIERTAALTGRSIAALHVWDALRVGVWARCDRRLPAASVTVIGTGAAGLAGLFAAVLDPAIGHVVLRDPPDSLERGPVFSTLLRDTDVPEVAGLLAPRPLTLMSARPGAFVFTGSVYDRLGASAAFNTAPSLSVALSGIHKGC